MAIQHPALKQGQTPIRYNAELREVEAARTWGITPGALWALPRRERVTIVAQYEVSRRIEAIQTWEANQKAKLAAAARTKQARHRPRK
jgi:hypothetical protein